MSIGWIFNTESTCGSSSAWLIDRRLTFPGLDLLPPYWIYVILEAQMLSPKHIMLGQGTKWFCTVTHAAIWIVVTFFFFNFHWSYLFSLNNVMVSRKKKSQFLLRINAKLVLGNASIIFLFIPSHLAVLLIVMGIVHLVYFINIWAIFVHFYNSISLKFQNPDLLS